MPFARWANFEECKLEQMQTGHDEESAGAICHAIEERAEKGMLLKGASQSLDIINKAGKDLIVGGYASWQIRDPQNDVITTKAQVKFLQKFFSEPEQFRNIMVKHGNFQIGVPLLSFTSPTGETVYSHVNEIGTYLIAKIRDNGWRSVQTIRKQILDGKLKMYSISGDPIAYHFVDEQGEMLRYIDDIDPWEVTLCEKGVNPKANVEVLSKNGKPHRNKQESLCKTEVCKGVCCTFVTEWSNRKDADLKKYLHLHGVETKDAHNGMWLKYPVVCKNFNPETYECTDWENRPDICKQYPRRESPFISKSICNLVPDGALRKAAEPLREPKTEHIIVSNEYEKILKKHGF